ncbi:MAG: response regulator [Halanaerobacter sp.]
MEEIEELKEENELLKRKLAEKEVLYSISEYLIAENDLESTLKVIVDKVAEVLEINRTSLLTFDLEKEEIVNFFSGGVGAEKVVTTVDFAEIWSGLGGWVVRNNKAAFSLQEDTPDSRESLQAQQRREETDCGDIMVVPLSTGDEVQGILTAINKPGDEEFERKDLDLLKKIADKAVAAIENARSFTANKEAKEEFEDLFNYTSDPIIIFDAEGQVIQTNHLACDYFSCPLYELQKLKISDLEADSKTDATNKLKKMVENETEYLVFESYFEGQSNELIPMEVNSRYIEYQNQPAILCIFRDITSRKETEEKLKKERDFLELVIDSSPGFVFVKDWDGRFQLANQELADTYGVEKEELLGQRDIDFSAADEEVDNFLADDREVMSSGEIKQIPSESITDDDGNRRWLKTVKVPLYTEQPKEERQVLGISTDITEMKRDEERLRVEKEKAQQANQAKSKFLATMSHEIRTPMNSIIGMTELLNDTDLSSEQEQYINLLENSSENLLLLINDVLDVSKIEAGSLELEESRFDLVAAVEDVAEMMAVKAYKKGLELPCRVSPALPKFAVGDQLRLKQILINLISNAVKFTEEGHVLVQADLMQTEGDKLQILFEVSDTGIGIAKERQDDIFKSFTQEDASSTRQYGGTGLGLTISQQLVELMDGEIWLESTKGEGSTFYFTVSLSRAQEETLKEEAGEKEDVDLEGVDVLVVDDNSTNLFILEEVLLNVGMNATLIDNPQDAWRELKAHPDAYQLVILDYLMPEQDGLDLAEKIREKEELNRLKLIMLSSDFKERNNRKDALEELLDDFMMKPIRQTELLEMIKGVLASADVLDAEQVESTRVDEKEEEEELTILLVEDVAENRLLINMYLKSDRYQITTAENGKQAVEEFKAGDYDLVLMDIQMPVMDGYEAAERIRTWEEEEEGEEATTIAALTAHARAEDVDDTLKSGFDHHLSKPIKKKKLFDFLAQL